MARARRPIATFFEAAAGGPGHRAGLAHAVRTSKDHALRSGAGLSGSPWIRGRRARRRPAFEQAGWWVAGRFDPDPVPWVTQAMPGKYSFDVLNYRAADSHDQQCSCGLCRHAQVRVAFAPSAGALRCAEQRPRPLRDSSETERTRGIAYDQRLNRMKAVKPQRRDTRALVYGVRAAVPGVTVVVPGRSGRRPSSTAWQACRWVVPG